MTYKDLPYYEDIKAKNKHENYANPLHTFRKMVHNFPYLFVLSVS